MNVKVYLTTWQGQEAWALESKVLKTIVLPQLGAKLVSLLDKRSGLEWLVDSGGRPLKPVSYGASFIDQDMSGWDEMFPTILACEYPVPGDCYGSLLPDHGEVWTLPWSLETTQAGVLSMSVQGKALPYRLTRRLSFFEPGKLQMDYILESLANEPLPYLWAAHPQFACGEQAEVILPTEVKQVCNTVSAEWGWGEPETRFDWPQAHSLSGQEVRIDHLGPSSLKQARKFFLLPETRIGWAGLRRKPSGNWLRLDWDSVEVPYLGIWLDEGAISHTTVAALEPMTGFYDSLDVAWKKQEISVLAPDETRTWSLVVSVGTGKEVLR